MANYQLTNKAVEDLNFIWNYTLNKWSEKQADKYYHALLSTCKDIASNPKLGKSYKLIADELFGLKINRHIVFYRKIDKGVIEITRILHGRMDIKNRIIDK